MIFLFVSKHLKSFFLHGFALIPESFSGLLITSNGGIVVSFYFKNLKGRSIFSFSLSQSLFVSHFFSLPRWHKNAIGNSIWLLCGNCIFTVFPIIQYHVIVCSLNAILLFFFVVPLICLIHLYVEWSFTLFSIFLHLYLVEPQCICDSFEFHLAYCSTLYWICCVWLLVNTPKGFSGVCDADA